jgi:hypothetical protein
MTSPPPGAIALEALASNLCSLDDTDREHTKRLGRSSIRVANHVKRRGREK